MKKDKSNPLYGVKKDSRHARCIQECITLGKLSYSHEAELWYMGPYSHPTAKGVFSVGGREYQTVLERREALDRDREHLYHAYRKEGMTIAREHLLSTRERNLERDEALIEGSGLAEYLTTKEGFR